MVFAHVNRIFLFYIKISFCHLYTANFLGESVGFWLLYYCLIFSGKRHLLPSTLATPTLATFNFILHFATFFLNQILIPAPSYYMLMQYTAAYGSTSTTDIKKRFDKFEFQEKFKLALSCHSYFLLTVQACIIIFFFIS